MRWEVRISGLGGQGIILAGYVLGKAACLFDGKCAVQVESYGPEARGSRCRSDVIISTEEIDYPCASSPDVLIALSQDAYNYYKGGVKSGGVIIVDEDLVEPIDVPGEVKLYRVPATRIAEQLGRRIVANIVMLGAFSAITGIVSLDALKKSILDSVPRGTEELNLKAVEEGWAFGSKLVGKA
ncbi:MAG: pyruvate ferredoxin oxidoreductase [Candidatus Methanomethylicota archaeon]|nr:2-oxoacid:acceptor oxidoreductase family protein [Candidatus Culexmicrobium cathedralense]RLE48983.1 MAG: pyruvate ferredoxin oxidoreductase [Candidatus Verstraetearchaeota archaeon]